MSSIMAFTGVMSVIRAGETLFGKTSAEHTQKTKQDSKALRQHSNEVKKDTNSMRKKRQKDTSGNQQ
jgi:hypothetical protein